MERMSDGRTLDRWPKSANEFPLRPKLCLSDLEQVNFDVDYLQVDWSWQQLRPEQ